MNYFMDRGIRIPEDLSITGFDDNLMSRIIRPALTTVGQDVTKKGKLAIDYMLKMIQGIEFSECDVKLPTEIVIRDSVRAIDLPVNTKKEKPEDIGRKSQGQ